MSTESKTPYLDKLEKLGASKQSSRKFVGAECESYLLWLTKPQLAALVDAEVAAAIERCAQIVEAEYTSMKATESAHYKRSGIPFLPHLFGFSSGACNLLHHKAEAIRALASTTNKEGGA